MCHSQPLKCHGPPSSCTKVDGCWDSPLPSARFANLQHIFFSGLCIITLPFLPRLVGALRARGLSRAALTVALASTYVFAAAILCQSYPLHLVLSLQAQTSKAFVLPISRCGIAAANVRACTMNRFAGMCFALLVNTRVSHYTRLNYTGAFSSLSFALRLCLKSCIRHIRNNRKSHLNLSSTLASIHLPSTIHQLVNSGLNWFINCQNVLSTAKSPSNRLKPSPDVCCVLTGSNVQFVRSDSPYFATRSLNKRSDVG